ncbi:MAG TPA: cupin domain-containing protein [Methylomirabilota bacterium]|nr:cupin domain-containing protein [Methylomirabilota bacterium]
MKPLVAKSWEAPYLATPSPYQRHRQVLFSSKTHGVRSAAVGTVTIPPGSKSDYHAHEKSDEFWIFTKGHGKVNVDGNVVEVQPGVVVLAPAESHHQIINNGRDTLHAYWILCPPGPEEGLLTMMREASPEL